MMVSAHDTQDAPPRVILVEDDDELREGLAEYLRLSGISVAEADSGASFRSQMQEGLYDVAILDVNLPDTTGFFLAGSLMKDPAPPGIIMLTARAGQKDRIQGYTDGADLYMVKPVDGEELRLAIRNLVRRMHDVPHAALDRPPAPWRLDPAAHRLIAPDGRAVALSGREVMLIEQFVRSEGAPIARASLAETLGYDAPAPESRALDAALRRLRQKLADAGLPLPIVSVHNVGVRFLAPLVIQ